MGLIYDEEGYEADADQFEDGVVIDEPAMAEALVVPEDSVDPETEDPVVDDNKSNDNGFSIWWFAAAGVAITLLVAVITYVCMNKSMKNDDNESDVGMEMT